MTHGARTSEGAGAVTATRDTPRSGCATDARNGAVSRRRNGAWRKPDTKTRGSDQPPSRGRAGPPARARSLRWGSAAWGRARVSLARPDGTRQGLLPLGALLLPRPPLTGLWVRRVRGPRAPLTRTAARPQPPTVRCLPEPTPSLVCRRCFYRLLAFDFFPSLLML